MTDLNALPLHLLREQIFKKVNSPPCRRFLLWCISSLGGKLTEVVWDTLFWEDKENVLNLSEMEQINAGVDEPGVDINSRAYRKVLTALFDEFGNFRAGLQQRQNWTLKLGKTVSNVNLEVISQCSRHIHRLCIQGLEPVNGIGFSRSISNWQNLTHLQLGLMPDASSVHMLREIGSYCVNLQDLQLRGTRTITGVYHAGFILKKPTSVAFQEFLQGQTLTSITFSNCHVADLSLGRIMKTCQNIECINLSRCRRIRARRVNVQGAHFWVLLGQEGHLIRPGFIKLKLIRHGNVWRRVGNEGEEYLDPVTRQIAISEFDKMEPNDGLKDMVLDGFNDW